MTMKNAVVMIELPSRLEPGTPYVIGRGQHANFRLEDDSVSNRHAQVVQRDGEFFVRDLNSRDGSLLNGRPVYGFEQIRSDDELILGNVRTRVKHASLPVATFTRMTLKNVSVHAAAKKSNKIILDDVSVEIRKGEFVGVLGASGSGKSTLVRAMAGLIDPTHGQIGINGEAMTAPMLLGEDRLSYLPQHIVIHESLSASAALLHIAKLKGITWGKRRQRVDEALGQVEFDGPRHLQISSLSGGQRKRIALAAELLDDPQALLLDEVTSGLDPSSEQKMMELFKALSKQGRAVICITHFPDWLNQCDKLLYLVDGRAVFYGSPNHLVKMFGVASIADVYVKVADSDMSATQWRDRFDQSSLRKNLEVREGSRDAEETIGAKSRKPPLMRQTAQLLRRYFQLQRTDWKNLAMVFGQAPVIAIMVRLAFGDITSSAHQEAAASKEVAFILVLATLWCSGTLAVREVVKEDAIFRHESRFGLRPFAYLLSKFILLGLVSIIQTTVLLYLVYQATHLKTATDVMPFTGHKWLVLSLTSLVGVAVGLVVSAIAKSTERAMTVLPIVLIAQAVFSSGFASLEGATKFGARAIDPPIQQRAVEHSAQLVYRLQHNF